MRGGLGSQDYLIKGWSRGTENLRRALLYAMCNSTIPSFIALWSSARGRAHDVECTRAESRRARMPGSSVACGPTRALDESNVDIMSAVPPGREMPCGLDFYDVVANSGGTVHVMIGDVAGHGQDAAALGAGHGPASAGALSPSPASAMSGCGN